MLFEIGLVTANILSFLGNITFTSSSVFKKKELIYGIITGVILIVIGHFIG